MDETVYDSAGNAVREQISVLRKENYSADYLSNNQSYIPTMKFKNSSVNSYGEFLNNSASNRVATEELLYIPSGCIAIIKMEASYLLTRYKFDENSVFQNADYNRKETTLESGFYRFLIVKSDNSDITVQEALNAFSIIIFNSESSIYDQYNDKLLLNHTDNITAGKYIATSGSEASSNAFSHTAIISLKNISNLFVRGTMYCKPAVMVNIAFYSRPIMGSGFFISGWTPSDTEQTTGIYIGLTEIPIPTDAEYMIVCSHNNFQAFDLFAVPEYHRYQTVASVMQKVVLCDTSKPKLRIKLIGDSITHGFGGTGYTNDAAHGDLIYTDEDRSWYVNTNGVCWANMLKSYLEGKFNCIVKNYGASGRASGHLRMYMEQLIEAEDSIVICMIGTNDRNTENDPYTGTARNPEQTLKNMQAIHDYCKSMGKDIIFMSSIPASVQNENSNKQCHMEDIDNIIMKLAARNNMEYISVYKLFLQYCKNTNTSIDSLLSDGLHPNDDGYAVMFELIAEALGFGIKRSGSNW